MTESTGAAGTPLVLLVNDEEWSTRSLESILRPEGYAVVMAHTGQQAVELTEKIRPDLLLIDLRLPDITGVDLCARLRRLAVVRPSTPMLLFSSGPIRRADELDAYRAGAWGVLSPPFDPQDLIARLGPLVAAKRDADIALESAYVDPATGMYNVQGLVRRVTEIGADTLRTRRPLACVVLGPSGGTSDSTSPDIERGMGQAEATDSERQRMFAEVLLESTRLSDVVGKVGVSDFVIIAPGTDPEGAIRLAERVMSAVDERAQKSGELANLDLRAGFYAVSGADPDPLIPEEILRRAKVALRSAQGAEDRASRIRAFQSN